MHNAQYDTGISVPGYARKSVLSLAWKPTSTVLGGFHCAPTLAGWNGLGVCFYSAGRTSDQPVPTSQEGYHNVLRLTM